MYQLFNGGCYLRNTSLFRKSIFFNFRVQKKDLISEDGNYIVLMVPTYICRMLGSLEKSRFFLLEIP